ncbi:MAG: hypothetical protein ABH865_02140 [Candidatus Omnitrophota bacterium]|nr:hypothetical protein [Candidatus Omnitrophota bacterium]
MKTGLRRFFLVTVGAILMMNLFGCSNIKFEKYSSKDVLINLSMDYIAGWRHSETRGAYGSYAQVMFFPFEKGNESPRAIIDITVKESAKIKPPFRTVKDAADDIMRKRVQFKDTKLLSESTIKVLGNDATVIELSYLAPGSFVDVKAKSVPVKEKIIITKKGDNFYFVRYQNAAKEFDQYDAAFSHMVSTMKLK